MPLEQKLTIWVLIAIAGLSAGYSLLTGQLFPKKTTAQYVPPIAVSPTPSGSIEGMLSQFQDKAAKKETKPTTPPRPTRDPRYDRVCTAKTTAWSYTTYEKGAQVRVDFKSTASKSGSAIITDTLLYAWEPGTKIGVKSELKGASFSTQDILSFMTGKASESGKSETCMNQAVASSQFAMPKGVVFSPLDVSMLGLGNMF